MIVTIGRKPYNTALIDNVLKNQCGGINIDKTRIDNEKPSKECDSTKRFPANVVFSERITKHLPKTNGAGHWANCKVTGYGDGIGDGSVEYFGVGEKDNTGGTVAKFFFIVKE